ncbi:MotA/TolQ/ExbB proton channel family protein [Parvibium lacunae]|uniref:MotA/TolQ/ExbB proton channel family protein n=1 Tax=Parvibium lacunae TaxID=1888893 RepID=A0A368L6W1_9BURK|nr:MotA/TolQ/ExbB proton channel family protein [Parvibium lacunae]RCS59366.1 MotA/TolQ/ExbB proton channel family protein [Parvibium lacunae]
MFSIIQAAGWPIWPLLLASVLAIALIIERALSLKTEKVMPSNLVGEVLQLHRLRQVNADVLQKLEQNSPLGKILAAGLRNERATREVMKEAIEEAGRAASHQLERFLMTLGTIASTAPLFGLFGTVVGMIEIFGASAPTGTNPQALAHGISVALYNTAFGIAVAIPAMIFYRYYRGKVDSLIVDMEQLAIKFVDALHGTGFPAAGPVTPASPATAKPAATNKKR